MTDGLPGHDPTLTVAWTRRWLMDAADDFDRADFMDHVGLVIAAREAESQTEPLSVNTPDTLSRVAKPPMVMRSIRVPAKLWEAVKAVADEREENVSDVVRQALERYVRSKR